MRRFVPICVWSLAALSLIGCGGQSARLSLLRQADLYGSSTAGDVDGTPVQARFANPANVEVGPDGAVYVADYDNDAVRMIAPDGKVSTLVKQSNFQQPFGLTYSPDGNLYVTTDRNDQGIKNSTSGTLWKVDIKRKIVTVVAANLGRPRGIVAISKTQIAMTDIVHHTIEVIDTKGATIGLLAGASDQAGHVNGSGGNARFNRPYGLCLLPDGSLLVADANNNCIRKVSPAGEVSDFAGTTTAGLDNGTASTATFKTPQDVAYSNGNVYVADTGNHVVRKISAGVVSTEAGDGIAGFVVAPGIQAEFYGLEGLAIYPGSNRLWIADGNGGDGSDFNHVREIRVP